jgi:hypothetical protein
MQADTYTPGYGAAIVNSCGSGQRRPTPAFFCHNSYVAGACSRRGAVPAQ